MSSSEPELLPLIDGGNALLRRLQEDPGGERAGLGDVEEFLARAQEALARVDETDEGPGLELAQLAAFARLTEINLLVNADRVDDAVASADRLLRTFRARPAGESLPGFGTMLLDVTFWLLAREHDADALRICDALTERLSAGGPPAQAVAAGARFYAAQASGRLGQMEQSRADIEALCEMGEPALSALDRIAAQFGAADANPTWHVQIAATTVTVLWRLGRTEEAIELARGAADTFERLELPQLQTMMLQLEREVASAG
jgi:tetratricopeptide (TPR) repeat protein